MKIVLLAYENDAYAQTQIGKQLQLLGHEVSIFSADFFSVTVAGNYAQRIFKESGFKDEQLDSLFDEFKTVNGYNKNEKINVDYEFLKEFESKLKGDRTLNNLIALDYIMAQFGHSRTYVDRPENDEVVYKTLELCLKKALRFLDKIKPDLIFTYGNNHLLKNLFYEISLIEKIPMFALDTCRVNNRYIILDNLWIGTSEFIKKEMERLEIENDPCHEAISYIDNMIKNNVQAYSFEGTYDLNNEKKYDFYFQLKPVLRSLLSIPRATINEMKDRLRRKVKNNYFCPKFPFLVFLYNLQSVFRIKSYFNTSKLNCSVPASPYVFVPLHMIPENNIFTDPDLIDEIELVRQISRCVPIDYKVVVKANPSMLVRFADTHSVGFYRKLLEIPNVVVVSPKLKSMPIIAKARALATISGTGLLEAAVLGIPAFAFGNPEFLAIDGVASFEKNVFKSALKDPNLINKRKQKYYIQAVLNNSIDLNFSKYYMANKKTSETQEFTDNFSSKVAKLIIDSYSRRY